jgi:hypothetical protein
MWLVPLPVLAWITKINSSKWQIGPCSLQCCNKFTKLNKPTHRYCRIKHVKCLPYMFLSRSTPEQRFPNKTMKEGRRWRFFIIVLMPFLVLFQQVWFLREWKMYFKKMKFIFSKNKEMCNFIENIFHMIKAYLRSTWPHLKFSFWGKEKSLSERVMLVKSYPSYSRN